MRIIVCSSNLPNPAEPNRGIYTYKKIWPLDKIAEIAVVAPVPYFPAILPSARYARYTRIPKSAVVDGVRVRYPRIVITPKVGRSLYGFTYAASLLPAMTRLVRAHRPDAFLAFWAYPDGFATVLLARLFRRPVFVYGLGCDVNDLDRHFGKRGLVGWTFRHCNGALAVSRALGSAIVALGVDATKVQVVPNGLDAAYLDDPGDAPGDGVPGRAGNTVLYCGRLSDEKDPLSLLQAFRLLAARRPDARLVVLGDGPLKPRIEALAAEWGLSQRVTLAGEVRHDEVARHMRRADVLCLSSIREGYPNVLLEGLACGLPVVATNVGGVPEIVTGAGLGILVPARAPEAMADALATALGRTWDREMLRNAVSGRSWHHVAREILGFMERTIG